MVCASERSSIKTNILNIAVLALVGATLTSCTRTTHIYTREIPRQGYVDQYQKITTEYRPVHPLLVHIKGREDLAVHKNELTTPPPAAFIAPYQPFDQHAPRPRSRAVVAPRQALPPGQMRPSRLRDQPSGHYRGTIWDPSKSSRRKKSPESKRSSQSAKQKKQASAKRYSNKAYLSG
jgi:hypothetical protein